MFQEIVGWALPDILAGLLIKVIYCLNGSVVTGRNSGVDCGESSVVGLLRIVYVQDS